jgi:hypothetical protein
MSANHEPQLAPPGAGLPKSELAIARMLFALRRMTGSRESFNARFQQERAAIQQLMHGLDTDSAARRVLIPRLRGLEDSSRHWSAWMTLDHLRIVHGGINRTIGALTKGSAPGGKASTAAVKPNPDVTADIVAQYEKSCDDLLATVAAIPNLKTAARYEHPWFGPLDAAGWHALASGHIAIHRQQIAEILKRLRAVAHQRVLISQKISSVLS